MDGQEPGEYYEYYHAQHLPSQPRALELQPSPPTSTATGVAYPSYAAPGDNAEQNRIHYISNDSGSSTYASYPLDMAGNAAHTAHRRLIPQLDGVEGNSTAYRGNYPFYHSMARPSPLADGLYDVQQSHSVLLSSNSAQYSPTELRQGPAAPAAMRPVHPPPERYPAESPTTVLPAPHDGAFYTHHHYASTHVPGSSSHTSINRPASLRASVRHREGSSMSGHLRSSRESYPVVHTSGPDMPHPVPSTSTAPAQQDFRTPHDPPPPVSERVGELTEPGPSPATALNEATADGNTGTPSLAPLRTLEDMVEYFPHHTSQQQLMRARLLEVMNAPWRRMNEKEPDSHNLLQFTTKIEEAGTEKYKCLIWSEGTECGKKIPRSDRMLEHLRRHVGVRPFTCDCNSEGCPGVFPSKSAMYQHQKNVEPVLCQRCVCVKICPDTGGPSVVSIQTLEHTTDPSL